MGYRKRTIAALAAMLAVASATSVVAASRTCRNGVCSRTTYDGVRVNVYLSYQAYAFIAPATHFNFRGEFGEQIEIGGFYSFVASRGSRGRFRAQACYRNTVGASRCSPWTTFEWRAR